MNQKSLNIDNYVPKRFEKSRLKLSAYLNSFMEVLTYGLLVIGFIQTIPSLSLILQNDEPRMPLEEMYSVKEYTVKLSELAKWLGNNGTFWLPDINNDSFRQTYMINFDQSNDQSPSICITSSLFFTNKNMTNSTNSTYFSSIKINLSKGKPYPKNVQILNGFN
ncbi:hypothetical protein BpHYR1_044099 [Brachionus plicatilis]|uniref:Uncharacterized protein n=1 Tax=Brachionus plicatilis TaxID=10195 RepID=A0A3M7RP46_BRAPC|nr:hypothetical protein BpHYR1_044099 [Brachionus plicatilis]